LNLENPFAGEDPNPYPAAALIPFMFFQGIGTLLGLANFGLFAYLFVMATAILYSVWATTRTSRFEHRILVLSVLIFLSPPTLAVLDRGNSAGFLVPVIIWLFHSIEKGRISQEVIALALLSIVKPHFGFVALAFIVFGRFQQGTRGLALGITLNVLPFLLFWPEHFPSNLFSWLSVFLRYQEYGSVDVPWPQNISFAQFAYVFSYGLDAILGGSLQSTLVFVREYQSLFGPLILLTVFAIIFIFRTNLTVKQVTIISISSIAMTSAISWYYYAVIAVPFLLALQKTKGSNRGKSDSCVEYRRTRSTRLESVDLVLWVGSILTMIQFPIPGFVNEDKILATGVFVGGTWILVYGAILVILLQIRREKFRSI